MTIREFVRKLEDEFDVTLISGVVKFGPQIDYTLRRQVSRSVVKTTVFATSDLDEFISPILANRILLDLKIRSIGFDLD